MTQAFNYVLKLRLTSGYSLLTWLLRWRGQRKQLSEAFFSFFFYPFFLTTEKETQRVVSKTFFFCRRRFVGPCRLVCSTRGRRRGCWSCLPRDWPTCSRTTAASRWGSGGRAGVSTLPVQKKQLHSQTRPRRISHSHPAIQRRNHESILLVSFV